MPITPDQIRKLLPRLVQVANSADHIEILDASRPTPFQVAELGDATFQLRYNRYNAETVELLVDALPMYTFIRALTIADLPTLSTALKQAYEKDVDAHRSKVPSVA